MALFDTSVPSATVVSTGRELLNTAALGSEEDLEDMLLNAMDIPEGAGRIFLEEDGCFICVANNLGLGLEYPFTLAEFREHLDQWRAIYDRQLGLLHLPQPDDDSDGPDASSALARYLGLDHSEFVGAAGINWRPADPRDYCASPDTGPVFGNDAHTFVSGDPQQLLMALNEDTVTVAEVREHPSRGLPPWKECQLRGSLSLHSSNLAAELQELVERTWLRRQRTLGTCRSCRTLQDIAVGQMDCRACVDSKLGILY
ncbi:hypothetical protein [Ornithinimicrobium sediminis]|uniref:hypothetical protein n=1 Tax=Ornithinimicrobium sediminis TaxID=2904603 RepID=UPI001E62EF89|nr:hypothetical protein [Ornithinimicrobium sediminis]MCE0488265.1 hypothetical protein [Ornithinimicrobium sediminis]